jgi:hypothetical protein
LNLPPNLFEHKTLMIAILLLARRIAEALEVDLDAPVAEICRAVGASRPSVYEQMGRVLAGIQGLADAQPGRPAADDDSAPDARVKSLSLTVDVLSYLLEHPGSAVPQRGRTSYAPAFRRFILTRKDHWRGALEAFAEAVRVPLDTLRDWLQKDRAQVMAEPEPKEFPAVPVAASELVQQIATEWQSWEGPTRAFFAHAARSFRISPAQVKRVLIILGVISPRRRRRFRYRGETHPLSPGTMLVTDGKRVNVDLTGSGGRIHVNWQAMVDQTTACDTAAVVTREECAAGVAEAYQRSLVKLGGVVPVALLHDNKPCYDDAALKQMIRYWGTTMIPATPARPENKAVVEGAFGLFEQRVGAIRLDDSNRNSLIQSAIEEVLRAYTAATNSVPRVELDGLSRVGVLQDSCPSYEQQQRDLAFLANLKAEHESSKRWQRPPDLISLNLLDGVFERLDLLDKDPKRSLRLYLARYEPTAIRRAAAVVSAKLHRGAVDRRWVHRYLVKVIQTQQDELDLERAAEVLHQLCRIQNQSWTHHEEREYKILLSEHDDPKHLALTLAENAAHGGIPVQATFWNEKLLTFLGNKPYLADTVITHLVRLYEAPHQKRLALIDLVAAQLQGVA